MAVGGVLVQPKAGRATARCAIKCAGSAEGKSKFAKNFLIPYAQVLTLISRPKNSPNFVKLVQVHPIMEARLCAAGR
jgi:hypothetical protein